MRKRSLLVLVFLIFGLVTLYWLYNRNIKDNTPEVALKTGNSEKVTFIKKDLYTDASIIKNNTKRVLTFFDALSWANHGDFERIVIGISPSLPAYEIIYEQYPSRLVIRLKNTRYGKFFGYDGFYESSIVSQEAFSVNQLETSLDKNNICFGIVLNNLIEFEVIESEEGNAIAIDIKKINRNGLKSEVYSVRTYSVEGGWDEKIIKKLSENGISKPRFLVSQGRAFCIEIAYYPELEKAEEKVKDMEKLGFNNAFVIEKRGMGEFPHLYPGPGSDFDLRDPVDRND